MWPNREFPRDSVHPVITGCFLCANHVLIISEASVSSVVPTAIAILCGVSLNYRVWGAITI